MRSVRTSLTLTLLVLVAAAATAQVEKAREQEKGKETPKELSRGSLFGGKNLDQWMEMLKSKDPSARENAIATLKLYGAVAREAIPRLVERTQDADVSIRVNAAIAMGIIGIDERELQGGVAALIRLLKEDSQAIVRYQAAVALSHLGTDAKAAIPSLMTALHSSPYAKNDSWEIRRAAAAALGNVAADKQNGPDSKVLAALAKNVSPGSESSAQVRLEAVLAIIVLGPPAKPGDKAVIERALQTTLKDPDKHVAIWGHMALMRLDKVNEKDLAGIAKYLKNQEPTVRAHVGRALGTVGPEARSRLTELIDALQVEEDGSAMYWIVFAMVELGDPAPRAIAALEQLQKHRYPGVSQMAGQALQMLKSGKMRPEKPASK